MRFDNGILFCEYCDNPEKSSSSIASKMAFVTSEMSGRNHFDFTASRISFFLVPIDNCCFTKSTISLIPTSFTLSTNSIRTISRYCSFSIPSACFAASSRLSEKPISLAELSSNWYNNSLLSIWLLRSIPVRKLRIGEFVCFLNV